MVAIVFFIYLSVLTPTGAVSFRSNFSFDSLAACEALLPAQRAEVEANIAETGAPVEILSMECGPQQASKDE